jgi:nucleoside-diphosphate-sugar epimerase
MRILITGAGGYIGGAIARSAAAAGYEVLALSHTLELAHKARALGYRPVTGDLTELATLAAHVRGADAVIHAAIAAGPDAGALDRAATEAMVAALPPGAPFVYTSGVWVLGPSAEVPLHEESPLAPLPLVAWRGPLERWLLGAADRGARTVVIRPGVAWGDGGGIPGRIARGELPLVGDGRQRWPVVHIDDLAALYLLAVDGARSGAILHGVGGVVKLADLVAAQPVHGVLDRRTLDEARRSLGDFADALAINQVVLADRTRAALRWQPRHNTAVLRFPAVAP